MSIEKMKTPPAELQIQLHQFINSQKAKVMITEEKDIQQTLVYIASPNPKPRQSCKISINKKSFTWICMQHLLIKCHHHNVAYNANIHVYVKGFSVMNKK